MRLGVCGPWSTVVRTRWVCAIICGFVPAALTSSAALEYAPRGIRINAVCPGTIATLMVTDMIDKGELDRDAAIADQPINRLGEPEEIAAAVLWLCSPGASFVVGVALPVDGGYTAR